jgi:hypothetical protein
VGRQGTAPKEADHQVVPQLTRFINNLPLLHLSVPLVILYASLKVILFIDLNELINRQLGGMLIGSL